MIVHSKKPCWVCSVCIWLQNGSAMGAEVIAENKFPVGLFFHESFAI